MKIGLIGTLILAAACSSSTSPGGGNTTGSLMITVSAPAGVSARVTVLGPAGYRSTITSSQTISGLDAGSYSIVAEPGTTTDPIVGTGYAGAVTGSPATITAGATANASVTYTSAWSTTGKLIVASSLSDRLSAYTSAQLAATGAPVPAVTIGNGTTSSTVKSPQGIAIDVLGGVWMVNSGDTIRYFTAAQVNAGGNPAPARSIICSAIQTPSAIAIDLAGNLWVSDQGNDKIFGFTAAHAVTGGTMAPDITLTAALGSIVRPFDIKFDKFGDLWVVNYDGNSIAGFTPAQLAVSGAPVPFAAVTGSQGTTGPLAAAFDAAGNLWVVTVYDTLSEYRASDLTAIGSPAPVETITGVVLFIPQSLAFDNSGSLWVGSLEGSYLLKYTASQLATSGALVPAVKISAVSNSMYLPSAIAFSPAAQNLPVQ
jgi:sugar lactone lactonase YvrE